MVLVYHVISQRPGDQRIMLLYMLEPFKVSHHPAKFGCHRHSGSGDIMVFVCHVTLQEHAIRALDDFVVRSPSR